MSGESPSFLTSSVSPDALFHITVTGRPPHRKEDTTGIAGFWCTACAEIVSGCRYGILVLVVEMLGATTTLLYGLNILFDPVHEDLPNDPENPGLRLVSGYNYFSP